MPRWSRGDFLGFDRPEMGVPPLGLTQAEFNALVDEHGAALYRMAFRMVGDRHEAEDLVQDAFRSAWTSRARYDVTKGDQTKGDRAKRDHTQGGGAKGGGKRKRSDEEELDLTSPPKGRAWLASILRRRVVDRWRKNKGKGMLTSQTDGPLEVQVEPEDPTAHEFSDEVQAALAKLPDSLRETMLLVVVGELTHQEVSEMLNVPLGTVLSRVSRARQRLRELLLSMTVKE